MCACVCAVRSLSESLTVSSPAIEEPICPCGKALATVHHVWVCSALAQCRAQFLLEQLGGLRGRAVDVSCLVQGLRTLALASKPQATLPNWDQTGRHTYLGNQQEASPVLSISEDLEGLQPPPKQI